MKVGVLALQGDVAEHERALDESGAHPVRVIRSGDLADIDALIIPGGESTTIGKLLARFDLLAPVRDRARGGMPLYGTCAGLILMARDVTGPHRAEHRLDLMDIAVRRNAYGRQIDSFEYDIDVAGFDRPFRALFIRAPVVESAGDEVEVLARVDGAPVLVRQKNLLASTFHPEMTGDTRVHRLFIDRVVGG